MGQDRTASLVLSAVHQLICLICTKNIQIHNGFIVFSRFYVSISFLGWTKFFFLCLGKLKKSANVSWFITPFSHRPAFS